VRRIVIYVLEHLGQILLEFLQVRDCEIAHEFVGGLRDVDLHHPKVEYEVVFDRHDQEALLQTEDFADDYATLLSKIVYQHALAGYTRLGFKTFTHRRSSFTLNLRHFKAQWIAAVVNSLLLLLVLFGVILIYLQDCELANSEAVAVEDIFDLKNEDVSQVVLLQTEVSGEVAAEPYKVCLVVRQEVDSG